MLIIKNTNNTKMIQKKKVKGTSSHLTVKLQYDLQLVGIVGKNFKKKKKKRIIQSPCIYH